MLIEAGLYCAPFVPVWNQRVRLQRQVGVRIQVHWRAVVCRPGAPERLNSSALIGVPTAKHCLVGITSDLLFACCAKCGSEKMNKQLGSYQVNLAEWSKAPRSGRGLFGGVGSNPTVDIFFIP